MSDQNSDGRPGGGARRAVELAQLRTFLAVYRTGSLTAAAEVLGVSQPTVTAQVRALEQGLGRDLFERLPRGVAPRPAAHDLVARVAGPLDSLETVVAEGAGYSGLGVAAPVRLAGPAEILSRCVLPALSPLVREGVRLRVSTGLADDLLAEVRSGKHDLVLSAVRPRGRSLHAEPLVDEEFVLVASPRQAMELGYGRGEELGPDALRDVPIVAYAEDLPILRRYWRHVFGVRLSGEAAVTMPDLRGVLSLVVSGVGVTVLPRYLCRSELAQGTLVALREPDDPPVNTGFLVWRPGGDLGVQVRRVQQYLLSAARGW
ncbi:LysR family transcriptional regulator [Lipingzhangella sp. LS1_29]|uniref:LysR family transcriptional regulator n=1 Tax=Lipingzhangella rawalii TaxID=2055835 RepID=A0ABU2H1W5_9ACTN|nr:LysR family transcriptional regulator [Lipingzhangella rawalii]MDS1269283.1 LysR family transcriptional regulator [Lipingzhangella rawalii]